MIQRVRTIPTGIARRAWSAVGRVVDTLAISPHRRKYAFSWRLALHLHGCALIGIGVALMLWNDFGPGPLDLVIGAIRQALGIPLTFAVWLTTGALLVTAWLLGRRPGFGNLVTIATVGPVTQLFLALFSQWEPPDHIGVKVPVHVAATAIVGVGAGMNLFARLGAGTGELLASAIAGRTGIRDTHVRMACELTWLGLGFVLGGPLGIGTAIVAILIGPFVAHGHRTVDGAITSARVATRGRIEWARTPPTPAPLDVTGPVPVMVSAGD